MMEYGYLMDTITLINSDMNSYQNFHMTILRTPIRKNLCRSSLQKFMQRILLYVK